MRGGIVGMASAYELATRGADVTVYEKGTLGSGSTGRSGGGIRSQFSTRVNVDLSLASKRVWDGFEEQFGVDIRRRRVGYLFLAREEATAAALRENVAMQNDRGVPSTYLSAEAAREHCPELHHGRYIGAAYNAEDEFVDPYLSLQGYASAARDHGVDVRPKTPVTDIRREGDAVTGVRVDGNWVDADFVVNAAGPWAGQVASMAAVDLPITPELHRLAIAEPEAPLPDDVPLTIDVDGGAVFRPEGDGLAAVGGSAGGHPTADPDDFPQSADLQWSLDVFEAVSEMCGYFGPESTVRDTITGLSAVTPDANPVIEETLPGLVNAVGFSGHGFMHAPAVGILVAELILDGNASLVDIVALSSDRFDGDTDAERTVI
ncbi:MAG: FAD-dependent oxidoreductase [Halolamina sp.]|uniref:NAD(P)/FAD-dependent oxidoreductase n=1 Tax=Halolamina sp. TaxID=1940283 RepID=UPI002FC3B8F9